MKNTAFFRQYREPYLPRFFRIFSVHPFFWVLTGIISGILASFFLWKQLSVVIRIPHFPQQGLASNNQEANVQKQYEEWKRVVEERPDYRDGYVTLAWYAQKLGKKEEAHTYLQKALSLDPNYSIPEVLQAEQ